MMTPDLDKRLAYKIVFDDLRKYNLCKGIYDAKNGSSEFMNGIGMIMELIALQVSDTCYNEFQSEFNHNIVKSEARGETNE